MRLLTLGVLIIATLPSCDWPKQTSSAPKEGRNETIALTKGECEKLGGAVSQDQVGLCSSGRICTRRRLKCRSSASAQIH